MAWNDSLAQKLINIAAFVLFTGGNSYGSVAPGSRWGAGAHPSYLTPEPWIFGTWAIIHILLIGLLVVQFTDVGHAPVIGGLGWRFPLLCVLNALYAGLSSAHSSGHGSVSDFVWSLLAFIVMIFVAGSVSHIYRTIKVHYPAKTLLEVVFIHAPFSLWHGFSVVLLFLSGFSAFGVDASHHKAGIATDILVFAALLLLEATAAGYALHANGDLVGAAVISAALLAIFQHQTISHANKFIHYSALVFFIISLVAVVRAAIAAIQGRSAAGASERTPLVA
ncbi:hypothetical protein CBOM_07188 [Ceraceosorus bombacis]|uniref:Uncharacterized protein n=2 Tax=Ceraceosorus TaxID=401624 RepID=A0A0P1B8G1_9BASI|nr:hypothetical protein IE81DRAFT_331218 [Ceraceosorus guamensis]PWN41010.1 hypothetical protein IE81DRAFT_331218 [Ceraceosorus guamensis]CEH11791.1 hypothetical protein CBOM_07188 [Ceraceosorus bombacis]